MNKKVGFLIIIVLAILIITITFIKVNSSRKYLCTKLISNTGSVLLIDDKYNFTIKKGKIINEDRTIKIEYSSKEYFDEAYKVAQLVEKNDKTKQIRYEIDKDKLHIISYYNTFNLYSKNINYNDGKWLNKYLKQLEDQQYVCTKK